MNSFIGEIRIFAANFPPKGWAFCNGQVLPISQNTALFSIIGIIYGGDGKSTFALPNLQGSAPLQCGQGNLLSEYALGQSGGESTVSLLAHQIPVHTHPVRANDQTGTLNNPQKNDWAASPSSPAPPASGVRPASMSQEEFAPAPSYPMYSASAGSAPVMNQTAFLPAGNNQPHNNMPPYLVLNFIIAIQGIIPPRS